MDLDDEICLCFHVSKRKLLNFLRVQQPRRASQLSDCQGAGTGCGWCRPYLEQLFDESQQPAANVDWPSVGEYARQRAQYIRDGKGTPPEDGSTD